MEAFSLRYTSSLKTLFSDMRLEAIFSTFVFRWKCDGNMRFPSLLCHAHHLLFCRYNWISYIYQQIVLETVERTFELFVYVWDCECLWLWWRSHLHCSMRQQFMVIPFGICSFNTIEMFDNNSKRQIAQIQHVFFVFLFIVPNITNITSCDSNCFFFGGGGRMNGWNKITSYECGDKEMIFFGNWH